MTPGDATEARVVAAARAGDQAAFAELTSRYRRELQVHCYRMLGSFDDSEDLVQETLLRAWKHRTGFEGRSTFRAWLYRIATNACLDALERMSRRPAPTPEGGSTPWHAGEVPWLQPFPDRLLDDIASPDDPVESVVARETIELAFIVAIQHLPPKQRAVLILRDVLAWSAKETATLLDTSVASVNSALQRARETLKRRMPKRRLEWEASWDPSIDERALLQRYMDASERADMAAMAELLREDALFSMPPEPEWYQGRDLLISQWTPFMSGPDRLGEWRMVPVWANRQPAAANYVRSDDESFYRGLSLDVLRVEDGLIAEMTTFGPEVFSAFDLPATL